MEEIREARQWPVGAARSGRSAVWPFSCSCELGRATGVFQVHRLPLDAMKYTTMPQMMKRLKGRARQHMHMIGFTATGMNHRDLLGTMPWRVYLQRRFESGPVPTFKLYGWISSNKDIRHEDSCSN